MYGINVLEMFRNYGKLITFPAVLLIKESGKDITERHNNTGPEVDGRDMMIPTVESCPPLHA